MRFWKFCLNTHANRQSSACCLFLKYNHFLVLVLAILLLLAIVGTESVVSNMTNPDGRPSPDTHSDIITMLYDSFEAENCVKEPVLVFDILENLWTVCNIYKADTYSYKVYYYLLPR